MKNSSVNLLSIDSPKTNAKEEVSIDKLIPMKNLVGKEKFEYKFSSVLIDAEQSSFEETLGIVPNKDNPAMLCLTFRSCLIGLLSAITITSVNIYFYYRTKSVQFHSATAILFAYPLGRFLAFILPKHEFFKNHWYSFSFNPGSFTVKEHTLIYTMAYIAAQTVPSCHIFILIKFLRTDQKIPMPDYFLGLLFVLCIQLLGYSLAGILRRIFVWPSEMIWLWNFPYMVAIRTMNEHESPLTPRWLGLTRHRFFLIVLIFAFIYQWFPGFIFPKLTFFPWWCLINKNSTILSQITGPGGLALGLIPLDWYRYIFPYMTPLVQPWWAYANMIVGFVIIGWIVIPLLYYLNVLNWSNLPILGNKIYPSPIDPTRGQYPVGTAIIYYIYFGVIISLVVHTLLYHSKDLIKYLRTSLKNRQNDVHCTLINEYKEAPDWIYGILFLFTFLGSCLICHYCHLMPWYYLFLGVPLSTILTIPICIVQAQAGIYIKPGLAFNVLGGSIFIKNPIWANTFFYFTSGIQSQSMFLLQNFKLAHHMKISPRTLLIVQTIITIISSTIAYVITRYLLFNEKDFCANKEYNCSRGINIATFFTNTDLDLIFGMKSVYPWLLWLMIGIGLFPFLIYLIQIIFRNLDWLNYIHIPIMFVYLESLVSPGNGYVSFPSWLFLGFIFRKVIHRWWFDRYAFLFQMAMIMGTFLTSLLIFFIFIYNNIQFPQWWGTQTNICPLALANIHGKFLL